MVKLITNSDNKVLGKSGFIKNAMFYKDMLAFYDAYNNLFNLPEDMIPNYCKLKNGKLCLEGICLFMKNYASELGFESIKLSLSYLKTIYYAMASYSKDDKLPDRKLIEDEIEEYKNASINAKYESEKKVNKKSEAYSKAKADFDKTQTEYAKKLVGARLLDGFFVTFLVLGFVTAMTCFAFYFAGKLNIITSGVAAIILFIFCEAIAIALKILAKKCDVKASELSYILQTKKKVKDNEFSNFKSVQDEYNRIINEKYEYSHNFSKDLQKFYKPLTFNEIAKLAKEYHLLSYNVKLDVINLFDSEEKEIRNIISAINDLNRPSDITALSEIYREIDDKDWLKFNNEIRFEFLSKFIKLAEKSYQWKLDNGQTKFDAFNIDAKKLAKQKVVYLKTYNDLFVTAPLDKLLNSNIVKNEKQFSIFGDKSAEKNREIKVNYLNHFYSYDKTKDFNNLFYDKKMDDRIKVSEEIINETSEIPTLSMIGLKIMENRLKSENAYSKTIENIYNLICAFENGEEYNPENVYVTISSDSEISKITNSFAEELEDYGIKYTYGETTFIGYKLV